MNLQDVRNLCWVVVKAMTRCGTVSSISRHSLRMDQCTEVTMLLCCMQAAPLVYGALATLPGGHAGGHRRQLLYNRRRHRRRGVVQYTLQCQPVDIMTRFNLGEW
jgi:hypothetical protein